MQTIDDPSASELMLLVFATQGAQFMIGKVAFAHQLYALGVISSPHLQYDCTAVEMLNLVSLFACDLALL